MDNAKKLYNIFSENGVVSYPVIIDKFNDFIANFDNVPDDLGIYFQIEKFEYHPKELYDSFRYFSYKGN